MESTIANSIAHDENQLIAACEQEDFNKVCELLRQGFRISPPHCYCCSCDFCNSFDPTLLSAKRLKLYQVLSSNAYLTLASSDPVTTCFQLIEELDHLVYCESYFKVEYLKIREALVTYLSKILENTDGIDELGTILSKAKGPDEFKAFHKYRESIDLSIEEFVAHPQCQQLILFHFYSGSKLIQHMNWLVTIIFSVILTALVYPAINIIYAVAPLQRLKTILSYPWLKCYVCIVWWIVFFGIVTLADVGAASKFNASSPEDLRNEDNLRKLATAARVLQHNCALDEMKPTNQRRISKNMSLILAILVTMTTILVNHVGIINRLGLRRFLTSFSNVLEAVAFSCYMSSAALWFIQISRVAFTRSILKDDNDWISTRVAGEKGIKNIATQLYWLNAERRFWIWSDPGYLAESTLAIGNLFTVGIILSYLVVIPDIGPLILSVQRMIKDVTVMLIIVVVFMFAFVLSFTYIYGYWSTQGTGTPISHYICPGFYFLEEWYGVWTGTFESNNHLWIWVIPSGKALPDEENDSSLDTNKLTAFPKATETIMWLIFGMGESSAYVLQPGSRQYSSAKNNYPLIPEAFGLGLWIICAMSFSLVMTNMVIALMMRAFESVTGNSDTSWQFSRFKIYFAFIDDERTLRVPPWNLVPVPYKIAVFLANLVKRFLKHSAPQVENPTKVLYSMSNINGVELEKVTADGEIVSNADDKSYSILDGDSLVYQQVIKRVLGRMTNLSIIVDENSWDPSSTF